MPLSMKYDSGFCEDFCYETSGGFITETCWVYCNTKNLILKAVGSDSC